MYFLQRQWRLYRAGKDFPQRNCETLQKTEVVESQAQIYKKVLGSRRFLASVFYSLSTAASDTQRKRAFVKTVPGTQHSQSDAEFRPIKNKKRGLKLCRSRKNNNFSKP